MLVLEEPWILDYYLGNREERFFFSTFSSAGVGMFEPLKQHNIRGGTFWKKNKQTTPPNKPAPKALKILCNTEIIHCTFAQHAFG